MENWLELLWILSLLGLWWWLIHYHEDCLNCETVNDRPRRRWQLRPRNPKDCALCQNKHSHEHEPSEIMPWSDLKSKRGRPKTVASEGYACPCKTCMITGSPISRFMP